MTRSVAPQQSLVVAGVARGEVTPPVGIYHCMWGAATHDLSTGVHRPLTATVLAMFPEVETAGPHARIAVALDHCLLWTGEMRTLIERVCQRSGIEPERWSSFSHTPMVRG